MFRSVIWHWSYFSYTWVVYRSHSDTNTVSWSCVKTSPKEILLWLFYFIIVVIFQRWAWGSNQTRRGNNQYLIMHTHVIHLTNSIIYIKNKQAKTSPHKAFLLTLVLYLYFICYRCGSDDGHPVLHGRALKMKWFWLKTGLWHLNFISGFRLFKNTPPLLNLLKI